MGNPSESPDVSRETLDGRLVGVGWMSWADTKDSLKPVTGALWHAPGGMACRAKLPDEWPFTSRMHAWGNGSMWRVLGDPRSDQVLVTQLITSVDDAFGDGRAGGPMEAESVLVTRVGVVKVTCADSPDLTLQRWQVRRKTPQGVDAAIEFLGPRRPEQDSKTSEPSEA